MRSRRKIAFRMTASCDPRTGRRTWAAVACIRRISAAAPPPPPPRRGTGRGVLSSAGGTPGRCVSRRAASCREAVPPGGPPSRRARSCGPGRSAWRAGRSPPCILLSARSSLAAGVGGMAATSFRTGEGREDLRPSGPRLRSDRVRKVCHRDGRAADDVSGALAADACLARGRREAVASEARASVPVQWRAPTHGPTAAPGVHPVRATNTEARSTRI